jgi:hypothetical protein
MIPADAEELISAGQQIACWTRAGENEQPD